jgi:protein TonB
VAKSEKFQTLKIVRPEYPKVAIRAGIEGLVRLEVQVDTTGKVVGVRTAANITASSEMEEAAIRAMLRWLFLPYREKNRPVPFTLIVPFRYRLVD